MSLIIKKLFQRKKENQRGATAVELAIVLILFLTIVFGIIEFGLLIYNQHIVTNAGREGARAGIVYRDNGNRISANYIENQVVRPYIDQFLVTFGGGSPQVNVNECTSPADFLSVEITYNYNFLFLGPLQREIKSGTIMRCE